MTFKEYEWPELSEEAKANLRKLLAPMVTQMQQVMEEEIKKEIIKDVIKQIESNDDKSLK